MNASDRDLLLGEMSADVKHIKETTDENRATLKEQNGRIGALERWQARILGGVGMAAVFVPIIAIKGDDIIAMFKGG